MLISRSVAVEQPALLDQGQTIGNLLETEESRIEIDSKAIDLKVGYTAPDHEGA